MSFWDAVNNLMDNNLIKRSSWIRDTYVQFHRPDDIHPLSHFLIHFSDGSKTAWLPTREDFEATDWEIYKES